MAKKIIEELVATLGYEYDPKGLLKFGNGIKKAIGFGTKLAAGLSAITGAAFGLSFTTAKAGDELAKFSRQVGISAEALQEFTFAADRQGVSNESLNSSFIFLNKSIGELRRGSGLMKTALEESNPELLRQLQIVNDTEEAFMLVLDEIERAPTEVDKIKIAMAAFGRSGAIMTRLAEAGADGIMALRHEFKALGGGISEDGTKQAEIFIDKMTNLKAFIKGLKDTIGETLSPVLIEFMQNLEDIIKANKDLIRTNVIKFTNDMVIGVKKLLPLVKSIYMLFVALGPTLKVIFDLLVKTLDIIYSLLVFIDKMGIIFNNWIVNLYKNTKDFLDIIKTMFSIGGKFAFRMPSIIAEGSAAGGNKTSTVNNAISQNNRIEINTNNPKEAGAEVDKILKTWTQQSSINMASGVL